jgi:hypothetical protein
MRSCYQAADLFILAEPHLPTTWIGNRRPVAPIARRGQRRRRELIDALGCGNDTVLALVTLGGIRNGADLLRLPHRPGVVWLRDGPAAPNMTSISGLAFSFIDVLASCDVVVTKTGYGTLVEAACHGVPALYVARPDWPESPYLEGWIQAKGLGTPVPADGDAIGAMVSSVLATRSAGAVSADGVERARDHILGALDAVMGGL